MHSKESKAESPDSGLSVIDLGAVPSPCSRQYFEKNQMDGYSGWLSVVIVMAFETKDARVLAPIRIVLRMPLS
jgi:hypothetical protein